MLRKTLFLSFILSISVCHSQQNPNYRILPYSVNPVQYDRSPSISHKKEQDGFDLKQVNADDLPPGEYEILAMFDGNDAVEEVPKPVGPPRDRVDAGKSLSHKIEYVRPPGSIFESYNRKPVETRSEPIKRSPFQHQPSTSYASQYIQHLTRSDPQRYFGDEEQSNEDRIDPYEPSLPVNQVRSLPRREPTPLFENKYRPVTPTPPPFAPTPPPFAPSPNAIPRPEFQAPEKFNNFPTIVPFHEREKQFQPVQDFAFRAQQPQLQQLPQQPHLQQQSQLQQEPQLQQQIQQQPKPQQHQQLQQQQLPEPVDEDPHLQVPDHHLPPVKKAAQPFRFPDEASPYTNFAPPPPQQQQQPTFQQRRPEPEFIYDDEQEYAPTPITPVKRKIASRPLENLSDQTEESVTPDPPTPAPEDRRQKLPRVIDSNKARNPLDRLKEIAGDSANDPVSSSGKSKPKDSGPAFVCPYDGHFGDPKDCTKFYRCAHGTALPDYCPGDLFWNTATEQCDWPEQTTCQFDPKNPEIKNVEVPTFVYLTFDDGPNAGTDAVLNALAAEGVRATFFINSVNLYDPKRENAERNARSLLRCVDEGHVLGDHSFDHMAHNSVDSPVNAYMNVDKDLKYFGASNINPVLDLLYGNDRKDENLLNYVNTTMMGLVRMPYTNNWRVPEAKINADCPTCTTPSASGQRGIEISNKLSAEGRYVIGWDLEWAMDFSQNKDRNQYGGSVAYMKLRTRHTKSPRKIVMLSHDTAYRPGSDRDEEKELIAFLQLAKKSGYTFRTLDTFATDNVNV